MNTVLDGEIVLLNEYGTANFGTLPNWCNTKNAKLVYFVFDILWYEGKLLIILPLRRRREILRSVLPDDNDLIRMSQAFEVDGIEFFETAKRMRFEGIIDKRADSL